MTNLNIEVTTYRINANRVNYLQERFDRIAKRARRIGCAAPTFEILSTEDIPVLDKDQQPTGRVNRVHTMRLIGERPIIAGYKFLGTLEHAREVGLILRTVPGEAIPVQYRNASPENCDHCHKRIQTRTETFIVEHVTSQTYKQVGRQCVADFLGGVDPKHVLALVEMLSECAEICMAAEDDDEEMFRGSRGTELYDMLYVLALTAALCRNYGWVPRSRAELWQKEATANRVLEYMAEPDKRKLFEDRYGNVDYNEMAKYETTDKDTENAVAALDWARSLSDEQCSNDYLHNLRTMAKAGAIQPNHFGLSCSIIGAYNREQEKLLQVEREHKQFAASQHFGEIKKRAEFVLTVTRYSTYESDFGVKHIYGFQDQYGNLAVWFGTCETDMERGKTYRVKATPKEHGEYKGNKQTVLSRVAVIEEVIAAIAA